MTEEDVKDIVNQTGEVLSETFKAALENPVHFQVSVDGRYRSPPLRPLELQPLPNAFELFGVDFVVTCDDSKLRPYLLEINSEPAIELTGPRLTWILEDLFAGIAGIAVGHPDKVGEHLFKCLDVEVRGERGW